MDIKHGLLISMAILASCLAQADVGHAKLHEKKQIPLKTPDEIRVLVIDSGVSPHSILRPHVNYLETEDYHDWHGHGTLMAGIVARGIRQNDPVCRQVRIFSCRSYGNDNDSERCVRVATKNQVDFINYSASGEGANLGEYEAMLEFSKTGGAIVVAAGNDHQNIIAAKKICPACYGVESIDIDAGKTYDIKTDRQVSNIVKSEIIPRLYAVSNLNAKGELVASSNYHPLAIKFRGDAVMSTYYRGNMYQWVGGTSAAAAHVTHVLLQARCNELKNQKPWLPGELPEVPQ